MAGGAVVLEEDMTKGFTCDRDECNDGCPDWSICPYNEVVGQAVRIKPSAEAGGLSFYLNL